MAFQIHALDSDQFSPLFKLDDTELKAVGARRETVTSNPGYPCRVSLADAEVGETIILVNFEHLPEQSPYRASHAIYVRENAEQAHPAPGEVPEALSSRLLSVRGFGEDHFMIDADVVDGTNLGAKIDDMFLCDRIAYIHVHNAKQGCFAAKVTRAAEAGR